MITNIRFLTVSKITTSYKRRWKDTVIQFINGRAVLVPKRLM